MDGNITNYFIKCRMFRDNYLYSVSLLIVDQYLISKSLVLEAYSHLNNGMEGI